MAASRVVLPIRVPAKVHAALRQAAAAKGVPMNTLATQALVRLLAQQKGGRA